MAEAVQVCMSILFVYVKFNCVMKRHRASILLMYFDLESLHVHAAL